MNTIKLRRFAPDDFEYGYDVARIRDAVTRHGYHCSLAQAKWLWEEYSASMAAGWMTMVGLTDDDVWYSVEPYIRSDES